jgi:thymidylate synthase (FAD)
MEATINYLEDKQKLLAWLTKIDEMDFSQKKILTSAFRRIAPMGLSTGIVFTANFRALRHIIELRTQPGAEAEMREIAGLIAGAICGN